MKEKDVIALLSKQSTEEKKISFDRNYSKNPHGAASFILKCQDLDLLNFLIDKGIDQKYNIVPQNEFEKEYFGELTLIQLAAFRGMIDLTNLLLSRGANPDITSSRGYTALHFAIAGMNLESKSATEKENSEKIIYRLISQGVDLNAECEKGTALHMLARRACKLELIDHIIKCGAKVDIISGSYDLTPLCEAIDQGRLDVFKLLISKGASVSKSNKYGNTPLHCSACTNNDPKYIEMSHILIKNGAKINIRNYKGHTPVHRAVELGMDKQLELLFANGADIWVKDNKGRTLLEYAIHEYLKQSDPSAKEKISEWSKSEDSRDEIDYEVLYELEGDVLNSYAIDFLVKCGLDIPSELSYHPLIVCAFQRILTSIPEDIYKQEISIANIISMKFLRKYSERDQIKAKFSNLPDVHPIYEILDFIPNPYIIDRETMSILDSMSDSPYAQEIIKVLPPVSDSNKKLDDDDAASLPKKDYLSPEIVKSFLFKLSDKGIVSAEESAKIIERHLSNMSDLSVAGAGAGSSMQEQSAGHTSKRELKRGNYEESDDIYESTEKKSRVPGEFDESEEGEVSHPAQALEEEAGFTVGDYETDLAGTSSL